MILLLIPPCIGDLSTVFMIGFRILKSVFDELIGAPLVQVELRFLNICHHFAVVNGYRRYYDCDQMYDGAIALMHLR